MADAPELQGGSQSEIPDYAFPFRPYHFRNSCADPGRCIGSLRQRDRADGGSDHCLTDRYVCVHSYANPDGHPCAQCDAYAQANGHANVDSYPRIHGDAASYRYANANANTHARTNSHSYTAAYCHSTAHVHSNRYGNPNIRINRHDHTYGTSNRHANAYPVSNCYTNTNPHSDCCAKGRLRPRNLRRRTGNCARHLCGYGRTGCAGFLLLGQAERRVRLI